MADGRLDRATLRKLPPWRAVVLARIAHRAHLMPRAELDQLTAEVERIGVDGILDQEPVPDSPVVVDVGGGKWTQSGMVLEPVSRRQTGSRHPSC